jgi:hypothetical protein
VVKPFVSSSKSGRKKISLFFATCLATGLVFGQKYFSGRFETGFGTGLSNYHGDLEHGNFYKNFHPSGMLFSRYNLSSYFSWRNQFSYLKISGSDAGVKGYSNRNFNFQSNIWELSSTFEFNFQAFGTNVNDEYWTPYFYSGLSLFVFDPKRLDNKDIGLRKLRTEGQTKPYSRLQPSIPIGFGIKTMLNPSRNRGVWILGVEGCWRKTFTDYLDDVGGFYPDYKTMADKQGLASAQYSHAQTLNGKPFSPAGTMRGDKHLRDWYYFIGFTASYRFTPLICR